MQQFFLWHKSSLGMLFYCISFTACLLKGEEQTLLYFSLIQQAFWPQSSKSFKHVLNCNEIKFQFIVLPMYLTYSMSWTRMMKNLKNKAHAFLHTHLKKQKIKMILLKGAFSTVCAMKILCSSSHPSPKSQLTFFDLTI